MSLSEMFQNFSTLIVLTFNTIFLFFSFIFILIIFEYLNSLLSFLMSKINLNKILRKEINSDNNYILIDFINLIESQILENNKKFKKRAFYKNKINEINNELLNKKNNLYKQGGFS